MPEVTEGGRNYDVSDEPEDVTPDVEPGDPEKGGDPEDEDLASATEDPALSLKEDGED